MSEDSSAAPSSSSERPQLSPRDIQLPPSPPFDSDDEFDTIPRRPATTERCSSESSIITKPVIHQLPIRSRNQSPTTPMARPHTSAGLTPPLMQRAHSSPGVDSSGRFISPGQYYTNPRRPASPLSGGRRRSPLRSAMEESYPVSWSGLAIEPNIPEHAELDLSERLSEDLSQISPIPTYHNTFPRSRRRPASPLHASASAPTLAATRYDARAVSPHAAGTSSPQPRYYPNEFYYSSASSMPSTPSSFRSRSPSISSLETIEDSPDAEEAAMIAAEEDSKYRAETNDSGSESGDIRRRSSLEGRGSSLRSNKERKRWSVCGAERRADFSLEPIEE
ncbi:hypothetical protein PMZ80_003741 [Knufia obscura]|uniref:Uncharacterized protein n=1 Tax=Knufia obscura TaxID=1635080 RepID=A0ABR0RV33_9EURO|nr:hypothetical protein PMZ80_003741 [Knufia obscura]